MLFRSISGPFHTGLHIAFAFSIACCLVAAVASWSRGSRYIATDVAAGLNGQAVAEPVDIEPLFGEPGDAGIGVASDDEDVEEVTAAGPPGVNAGGAGVNGAPGRAGANGAAGLGAPGGGAQGRK